MKRVVSGIHIHRAFISHKSMAHFPAIYERKMYDALSEFPIHPLAAGGLTGWFINITP